MHEGVFLYLKIRGRFDLNFLIGGSFRDREPGRTRSSLRSWTLFDPKFRVDIFIGSVSGMGDQEGWLRGH